MTVTSLGLGGNTLGSDISVLMEGPTVGSWKKPQKPRWLFRKQSSGRVPALVGKDRAGLIAMIMPRIF